MGDGFSWPEAGLSGSPVIYMPISAEMINRLADQQKINSEQFL